MMTENQSFVTGKWTAEEDGYLRERYPLESANQISRTLNRSLSAVQNRANLLEVEKVSYVDLYGSKIKELAASSFTVAEISKSLGLKYATVRELIRKMNIEVVEAREYVDKDALRLGIENPIALPTDVNEITFSDYYRHWYNTYRKDGIREVTKYSYRNVFSLINKGDLGEKKLNLITRSDVQNYVNWYGQNRSKQTVLDHIQYIRSCLNDAMIDGYIKQNPAGNIVPVYKEQHLSVVEQKRLREQKKWLEVEEYQKFRYYLVFELQKTLKEEPHFRKSGGASVQSSHQLLNVIMFIGMKTGARLSELVGLTKEDISFEESTINIDKTWDYKGDEGSGFSKTKNLSSIRKIVVDRETMDLLQMYLDWLEEHQVKTSQNTLFIVENYRFHNSTVNSLLKRNLKKLQIEPISMHKLRHTHASYLIAKGVPLQVIAKRLGHTDTQMIQKVYGHLLEETEETGNKMILNLI